MKYDQKILLKSDFNLRKTTQFKVDMINVLPSRLFSVLYIQIDF